MNLKWTKSDKSNKPFDLSYLYDMDDDGVINHGLGTIIGDRIRITKHRKFSASELREIADFMDQNLTGHEEE